MSIRSGTDQITHCYIVCNQIFKNLTWM